MPKFAKTLERISDDPEGFYSGELAKDVVKDIQEKGGIITLDDLKNYRVKFRQPMNGSLGNYSWYSTPPPGSGVVLSFILNILKGKGPVIIYRLGAGGGGWRILGGNTRFLGEQKGRSVVTENPKGGSLKTLEGFRGETTQFAWIMKTCGEDRESHQKLLGAITSVK